MREPPNQLKNYIDFAFVFVVSTWQFWRVFLQLYFENSWRALKRIRFQVFLLFSLHRRIDQDTDQLGRA
jgi:hypothetical protein